MAQQAVLRVHAERRGRADRVFHPECHLHEHEGQALERLHRLVGRPVGRAVAAAGARRPPRRSPSRPAALLLELPQRDLGGQAARLGRPRRPGGRGQGPVGAAHLDGARLWEAAASHGRPPAEIAGLFDTAYVSFYKGIGALAGAAWPDPADVVAEVREWRRRMGGTLFKLWPGAASALCCLRRRLPLMPALPGPGPRDRRQGARACPASPSSRIRRRPRCVHLVLRTGPRSSRPRFGTSSRAGWGPGSGRCRAASPGFVQVELSVGDATLALSIDEIRKARTDRLAPGRSTWTSELAPAIGSVWYELRRRG